jgi:hypothetical protein
MRAALLSAGVIVLSAMTTVRAQAPETPLITQLEFIIGEWDITFDIYDTHKPGSEPIFTEAGVQRCSYDLEYRGKPTFITCIGKVTSDRGRVRNFQESIRYNQFIGSFERIGIYSNWPAHGVEQVSYDPDERELALRGELMVQDRNIERYEDVYTFSDDFNFYTRRNVANFPDMRASEYNLTLAGTDRKRK